MSRQETILVWAGHMCNMLFDDTEMVDHHDEACQQKLVGWQGSAAAFQTQQL